MTIIATCGHEITSDECFSSHQPYCIMRHSRTGERVLSYEVLCSSCACDFLGWGIVLDGERMEDLWMRGEIEYPTL